MVRDLIISGWYAALVVYAVGAIFTCLTAWKYNLPLFGMPAPPPLPTIEEQRAMEAKFRKP